MIALVNQTAVPALQHGSGMTIMDDDVLATAYNDLLTNFGAVFAATHKTMKSQANNLVAIQNQLSNIQLCMNVSQHPQATAMFPLSNNARPPTTASAMAAARAMAVVSHNNQP